MGTVSLLDLAGAAAPATVSVRGFDVAVTGIPAVAIARFLRDVPALAEALKTRSFEGLDLGSLLVTAPETVEMLIAAGTGHYGNPEHEAFANTMSITEQTDMLEAILKQTFPGGIGPFVDRLTAAAKAVGSQMGA